MNYELNFNRIRANILVVEEIDNQGDRLVLKNSNNRKHVIASVKEVGNIEIGDTIEYEPEFNFGWFIKIIKKGK